MSAPAPPLSVRASFEGTHVLVTGITGFVGKVWLGMLLQHVPEVRRVTVLIRAREHASARDRFERIAFRSPGLRALRHAQGPALQAMLRDRVTVIEGDCGKPLCGLDPTEADRVCHDVDLVAHFAGDTDFMGDPRGSLAANVDGALHVADLAARTRGRRLLHVSTCFVAGRASGEVPERVEHGRAPNGTAFEPAREREALGKLCASIEDRRERIRAAHGRAEKLGWPNIYTYTKGLAEQLLADRRDVQTTFVRPAIVECARRYPFAGWNEGINTSGPLVWLFSTGFRHFPSRPHHRFDVVPVDTAARGTLLVAAAALSSRAQQVHQLACSDTNPLTFRRAIELTNLAVRRFHSRPDARRMDRWLTRHLDVTAVGADDEPVGSPPSIERLARRARGWLDRPDLTAALPPTLRSRFGERLEQRRAHLSGRLRDTERQMRRIRRMLDLYRPFTHDHDHVFRTDGVRALSNALVQEERELFAFDVDSIDWHRYWLEVQVPGLEQWSLPLLRGEPIPEDPPPPLRATGDDERPLQRPEDPAPRALRAKGEGVRP